MTKSIFEIDSSIMFVLKTVVHLQKCGSQALLFLEYCLGDPINLHCFQDHTKVVFLSANITSFIQPVDQNVMCFFKLKYFECTVAELHSSYSLPVPGCAGPVQTIRQHGLLPLLIEKDGDAMIQSWLNSRNPK